MLKYKPMLTLRSNVFGVLGTTGLESKNLHTNCNHCSFFSGSVDYEVHFCMNSGHHQCIYSQPQIKMLHKLTAAKA